MKLAEKVVLLTGASEGIGKAIALRLAQEDMSLALVARTPENLKETLLKIETEHGVADIFPTDVTQAEQVKELVNQVLQRFGRIDVLINNVGKGLRKPFVDLTEEDWQYLVRVNLTSVMNCCQAVLPQMRKQGGGQIINISSKSGRVGEVNFVGYCAVKHGVVGLTRALALEEAPFHIGVNAICPGPVATTGMKKNLPDADMSEWLTPEDVAESVLFVLSSAGKAMLGKTIDLF